MNRKKNLIPSDGLIGNGNTKKTSQAEYDKIADAISVHQKKQSPNKQTEIELASIKLEMGNYLLNENSDVKISGGNFLKKFIKATKSKNKTFAKYIGLEESNLSSIISGRRKINLDFALKLEQIFGVPANWWLEIQLKNEFKSLSKKRKSKNGKYSLKGLLKKVG